MLNTKGKVRRAGTFAAAVLCLTLTVQAAELPCFKDVQPDSPVYEAVVYMKENGISSGVGNDIFGVESPITVGQLCVFLVRSFGTEADIQRMTTSKNGVFLESSMIALEKGWIGGVKDQKGNATITKTYMNTKINRWGMYGATLAAAGIEVYSANLFSDRDYNELGYEFTGSLRTAHEMGLTEYFDGASIATRGEAAELIHALKTKMDELNEPDLPDIMKHISITADGAYVPEEYVAEIAKLPDKAIKEMSDAGYSFRIGMEYINAYNAEHSAENGFDAIGLTSTGGKGGKVCYLGAAYSAFHEAGHALDYIYRDDDATIKAIYEVEGKAMAALNRDYSGTNQREFYADCFTWFIQNQNNQENMAKFKAACPQMYQFLIDQNWYETVVWPSDPVAVEIPQTGNEVTT